MAQRNSQRLRIVAFAIIAACLLTSPMLLTPHAQETAGPTAATPDNEADGSVPTTPEIEVDPETYEVRADGELLTCAPAEVLPRSPASISSAPPSLWLAACAKGVWASASNPESPPTFISSPPPFSWLLA